MDNNDILRRIRYTLNLSDSEMIDVFKAADYETSRSEISDWLKKDDDPSYAVLTDKKLAIFLNGLINTKRGKREGEQVIPENHLNNNIILKKLKIAFNLTSDEILEMFKKVNKNISAHELSSFLRNPDHGKYRECNDQYLRNFLQGLQAINSPD